MFGSATKLIVSVLEESIAETKAAGLHDTVLKLSVLLALYLALTQEDEVDDLASWERLDCDNSMNLPG